MQNSWAIRKTSLETAAEDIHLTEMEVPRHRWVGIEVWGEAGGVWSQPSLWVWKYSLFPSTIRGYCLIAAQGSICVESRPMLFKVPIFNSALNAYSRHERKYQMIHELPTEALYSNLLMCIRERRMGAVLVDRFCSWSLQHFILTAISSFKIGILGD